MAQKSDHRAEISGNIVWYDAPAPRPEVLLFWHFACACAVSLELEFLPYPWGNYICLQIKHGVYQCQFLQHVGKILSSSMRIFSKSGNFWPICFMTAFAKCPKRPNLFNIWFLSKPCFQRTNKDSCMVDINKLGRYTYSTCCCCCSRYVRPHLPVIPSVFAHFLHVVYHGCSQSTRS